MPAQTSAPPELDLPPSQGHTVRVSAINGTNGDIPVTLLVDGPYIAGHEQIRVSDYSFLIESDHKNQKVLFDLATMKDKDKFPPAVRDRLAGVEISHDIADELLAHDLPLSAIDAIIWSHHHFDHTGDPSLFPPTTDLVLGPGGKAESIPGYPLDPESQIPHSCFEHRTVREVDFAGPAGGLTIGGFRALDYFDDGSLYLLHTPGHTAHHLSALARTTPDTFVLLGGDACHHMGQLRPSPHRPLPDKISPDPTRRPVEPRSVCPCLRFQRALPDVRPQGPYYGVSKIINADPAQAEDTVRKVIAFDASPAVFVIPAHDPSLMEVADMWPKSLNAWRDRGWNDTVRWRFLGDFKGLTE